MVFDFFNNKKNDSNKNNNNKANDVTVEPFTFEKDDDDDNYKYPDLYDEADSMLQVSLLIYTVTDLRTLAKDPKKSSKLKSPQQILTLPLSLGTCLEMIEMNLDTIKNEISDDDHVMTMSALQSIQERYDKYHSSNLSSSSSSSPSETAIPRSSSVTDSTKNLQWWNPFTSTTTANTSVTDSQDVVRQQQQQRLSLNAAKPVVTVKSPYLVAYGDEKPLTDLVYAVGVDPLHKRVTVAFRGSVTPSDFLTDACISIQLEPNPVFDKEGDQKDQEQNETIGIHYGFYDYLLKPKKDGKTKYEEVLNHVKSIFAESPERQQSYKLYVTGHSLGGALATLFSFYVASEALTSGDDNEEEEDDSGDDSIRFVPTPVTCVSVASPRVGEGSFQRAFRRLEECGMVRHLRIANDRDPVTIMPKSSGKKVWANLSPISYMAFKLMDNQFEEKETFRHTGIKLRMYAPPTTDSGVDDTVGDTGVDASSSIKPPPKLFEFEYSEAAKPKPEEKKKSKKQKKPLLSNKFKKEETKQDEATTIDSNTVDDDEDNDNDDGVANMFDALGFHRIPNVVLHIGKAYTDNLANIKDDLKKGDKTQEAMTLNNLYKSLALNSPKP